MFILSEEVLNRYSLGDVKFITFVPVLIYNMF